jgi:hypothetical protein
MPKGNKKPEPFMTDELLIEKNSKNDLLITTQYWSEIQGEMIYSEHGMLPKNKISALIHWLNENYYPQTDKGEENMKEGKMEKKIDLKMRDFPEINKKRLTEVVIKGLENAGAIPDCRIPAEEAIKGLENTGDILRGLAPTDETVANEKGALQSPAEYAFDLLPPRALFGAAHVMFKAAKKYKKNNWKKIPIDDHLNRAAAHIYGHILGDRSEGETGHLRHALVRLMFALELAEESPGGTGSHREGE